MISVDRVYQTVNTLLNQHGEESLTNQQFNLLGNKAQIDTFEGHFYDLKNALGSGEIGKGSDWGDIADNIRDKIQIFERQTPIVKSGGTFPFPTDYYRLTAVYQSPINTFNYVVVEEVSHSRVPYILNNSLSAPKSNEPIYVWSDNTIAVFPDVDETTHTITISYLKTPADPVWVSTLVDGRVMYDTANSTDFELHPSDFPELVAGILSYAGVILKRAEIVQFAQGEDQQINASES